MRVKQRAIEKLTSEWEKDLVQIIDLDSLGVKNIVVENLNLISKKLRFRVLEQAYDLGLIKYIIKRNTDNKQVARARKQAMG